MYRVGEMVWMELPEPIKDSTGEDETITHWPVIVTERYLFNKGFNVVSTTPALPGAKPQPKFSFKLSWAYDVSALACSDMPQVSEAQLAPFYERPTPDTFVDADSSVGMEHVFRKGRERRAELDDLTSLDQARIPFALAIQIAININGDFSLMWVSLVQFVG